MNALAVTSMHGAGKLMGNAEAQAILENRIYNGGRPQLFNPVA